MTSIKQDKPVRPAQAQEDDENDSEDELLAQAAAQWASKDATTTAATTSSSTSARHHDEDMPKPPLSLHVTQLSFDATDYNIRTAFVQQGCAVTSVRLVYDRDGSHKTFRGVAFVDVGDEDSYEKALKLDRSTLMGRRINVRPTKSKSELANIVERTKELVAEKIRKEREAEDSRKQEGIDDEKTGKKRKKSDKKEKRRDKKQHDAKGVQKKANPSKKHKSPGKDGDDRKLTKKERNRRAAIIMTRRRGKR